MDELSALVIILGLFVLALITLCENEEIHFAFRLTGFLSAAFIGGPVAVLFLIALVQVIWTYATH